MTVVTSFFLSVVSCDRGRVSRLSFIMPESVAKVRMPPPLLVSEYIFDNLNRLYARSFAAMLDAVAVE